VPIVELRGVSKRYGDRTVIDDLSLVIPEAETLVLLGTSGSGKTTALKMINRLVEPTEGTIRVFDEDVHGREPVELRRRIGYVIQDVGLFPHYTVRQNIAVVPELLRWPEERKHARVDELLTLGRARPGWTTNATRAANSPSHPGFGSRAKDTSVTEPNFSPYISTSDPSLSP
jgi:osmoprotectant transport system ATP-binding protein